MRVVAVGSQGRTRLETRERPLPGPGELVLQLRACGLCGTDLFKLAGGTVAAGSVLGHELVGTVVELGKGTSGFSVGERVTVPHHVACGVCALCRRGSETLCEVFRENLLEPGGFAEYVLVKPRAVEQAAYRVPEGLSDEAAVFLEPAACVLRGILRAGFRVGENSALASGTARAPGIEAQGSAGADDGTAVVLGAGGMGLLHVALLRALFPALKILCMDLRLDRLSVASKLGATATSLPGQMAAGGAAAALLADLSAGLGADVVFDTVGGAGILNQALELSREGGTVVLFAHAPSDQRAGFDLNGLFKYERRVIGTYSGGLQEQRIIQRLLESRVFDPSRIVTHRMPLSDFERAVALARANEALKILLVPDEEV